jgi:uncharacterized protein
LIWYYLYGVKAAKAKKEGDMKIFEQASQQKITLFQKAAQKGSSNAMYQLAYVYEYGDYVKVNLQEAIQWYEKSTSAGNVDAAESLAKLYSEGDTMGPGKPEPQKAAKYFRRAMDLGSKTAGFQLAELIRNGKVISQTPDEALKLYEQALATGSLAAAAKLSDIYLKGGLVTKDLKKAEQYALKAIALQETTKPDSEDAWPIYMRLAAYNLLTLYKKEKLQPTK